MNLSRCANGHFYDKEKYAVCPHCSGGGASDESLTTVFTEDVTVPVTPTPQAAPQPAPVPPVAPQPAPMPAFTEPASPFPVAGMAADQLTVDFDSYSADSVTVPLDAPIPPVVPVIPVPETAEADDDDHTVGFFDNDFFSTPATQAAPAPQAAPVPQQMAPVMQAAPAAHPVNKVSTPCVGWLIALGGEHIGTDFRLKVGKNFIGRGANMDVALTEDKSVSRDKHAIVVYEPKAHLYLVQPGESSSLVYRNNEVVLSPVKLEAYDMITVGDVNLLFIPLCGERFNWSTLFDEMKKNK